MAHRFRFVPLFALLVSFQVFATIIEDAAFLKAEASKASSFMTESLIQAIRPANMKANAHAPLYSMQQIAQMSAEELRRIRETSNEAKSGPSKRVRINNSTYVVSQILGIAHAQCYTSGAQDSLLGLPQIVEHLSELKSRLKSVQLLFSDSQVDYQYATFGNYVGQNEFGIVIELNDGTTDDNNDYGRSYPGTYLFFVFHPIN